MTRGAALGSHIQLECGPRKVRSWYTSDELPPKNPWLSISDSDATDCALRPCSSTYEIPGVNACELTRTRRCWGAQLSWWIMYFTNIAKFIQDDWWDYGVWRNAQSKPGVASRKSRGLASSGISWSSPVGATWLCYFSRSDPFWFSYIYENQHWTWPTLSFLFLILLLWICHMHKNSMGPLLARLLGTRRTCVKIWWILTYWLTIKLS